MTAQELGVALYAKQGFLVVCSHRQETVGTINLSDAGDLGTDPTPLRIVAESTLQEFLAQRELGTSLLGYDASTIEPGEYFYRVVAAD